MEALEARVLDLIQILSAAILTSPCNLHCNPLTLYFLPKIFLFGNCLFLQYAYRHTGWLFSIAEYAIRHFVAASEVEVIEKPFQVHNLLFLNMVSI
jgi:hypothetical protein